MDNIIKYVGFYDLPDSNSNRVCNLAATNKMDYISSAIVKSGYNVEVISPSWMGTDTKKKYEKQINIKMDESISVTFCPSWKTSNRVTRNIKILFSLVWLFFYLLWNVKRKEKVLAYHVPWISLPIRAAKFIKRFELILEVEEIYQDVMKVNSFFTTWENKLIDVADSYLLSTDLLVEKIPENKPYITIYGVYNVKDQLVVPENDGLIHLLYAGIIDSHKKGAFNALESTKYLSDKYHLHIIGFGETEKLCSVINMYNKDNKCKVSYDGVLSGVEYIKYCQSCHIGLSTQSMDGSYLKSSFPSKILSYLSMGLRVVSGYIDCVSQSKIGNFISYYNEDNPEEIAKAIMSIDISQNFDSRNIIQNCNKEFINDIQKLLED